MIERNYTILSPMPNRIMPWDRREAEDVLYRNEWDQVVGANYGQRRTELLNALGLACAIENSKRVKQETGEFCSEFSQRNYIRARRNGLQKHLALAESLWKLSDRCINSSCQGKPLLSEGPISDRITGSLRHFWKAEGLAAGAMAYSLLDQIPEESWDRVIEVANEIGRPLIDHMEEINEKIKAIKPREMKDWLVMTQKFLKDNSGNRQQALAAVLSTCPVVIPIMDILKLSRGSQPDEAGDKVKDFCGGACNTAFKASAWVDYLVLPPKEGKPAGALGRLVGVKTDELGSAGADCGVGIGLGVLGFLFYYFVLTNRDYEGAERFKLHDGSKVKIERTNDCAPFCGGSDQYLMPGLGCCAGDLDYDTCDVASGAWETVAFTAIVGAILAVLGNNLAKNYC